MLVQWTTRDKGAPVVMYGAQAGKRTSAAPAETGTYGRQDLCGGVANSTGFMNPGLFHTAALTGLQPDTAYFYVYGDEVPHPCSAVALLCVCARCILHPLPCTVSGAGSESAQCWTVLSLLVFTPHGQAALHMRMKRMHGLSLLHARLLH